MFCWVFCVCVCERVFNKQGGGVNGQKLETKNSMAMASNWLQKSIGWCSFFSDFFLFENVLYV